MANVVYTKTTHTTKDGDTFILYRDKKTGAWALHAPLHRHRDLENSGRGVMLVAGDADKVGITWSRPDANDIKRARELLNFKPHHTIADLTLKVLVSDEEWNKIPDSGEALNELCATIEREIATMMPAFIKDKHGIEITIKVR